MSLTKKILLGVSIAGVIQLINQYLTVKSNKNQKQKVLQSTNIRQQRKVYGPILQYVLQSADYSDKEEVIIRDIQQLKNKLKQMRKDGIKNLQIATDFDQTITPFKYQGKPSKSAFGLIRTSPAVPQEMSDSMAANFKKYYPYEQDHSLSIEEKQKYIREWYDNVEEIFRKHQLSKETLQTSIDNGNVAVRSGFKEFFSQAYKINLPYYVVSGGINLIVNTVLNSIVDINEYDNLFLVANNLYISNKGKAIDLEMFVDTSKKHEILSLENYGKFCKNSIVLGDTNNDKSMADNIGESQNSISILFLNPSQEKDLDKFLEKGWDIVIKSSEEVEGSYIVPIAILDYINQGQFQMEFGELVEKFRSNKNYKEIQEALQQQ